VGGKIIISTPKDGAKLPSLIAEHLRAQPGVGSILDVMRVVPTAVFNLRILKRARTGEHQFLTADQVTSLANPDLLTSTYAGQNWLFEVTVE
jgi:hypothetical protein